MKYETLLVLSVNNYFIHFNKDTRSSKELPLDNMGKLESKMHDISNKWKCIDILFKALSKKTSLKLPIIWGIKKKNHQNQASLYFRPDQFYIQKAPYGRFYTESSLTSIWKI